MGSSPLPASIPSTDVVIAVMYIVHTLIVVFAHLVVVFM